MTSEAPSNDCNDPEAPGSCVSDPSKSGLEGDISDGQQRPWGQIVTDPGIRGLGVTSDGQ